MRGHVIGVGDHVAFPDARAIAIPGVPTHGRCLRPGPEGGLSGRRGQESAKQSGRDQFQIECGDRFPGAAQLSYRCLSLEALEIWQGLAFGIERLDVRVAQCPVEQREFIHCPAEMPD